MICATCPSCGADLEALHSFSVGDLTVEYDGAIMLWKGQRVDLSQAQKLIVLALARANGAPIKRYVLADASGYEGDNADGNVAVHLYRIHRAFRAVDPDFDAIENIRSKGLRWRS